ncbi:putative phage tail protein [Komagataeibacter xylinus]|uniref:putative phage tail protein n=1 Tax=Komagataeibacter xylinus TaxID=28448 RepID=UPI00280C3DC8|nr:putative phage tail protein [Komagataeibacter xylinus]
MMARDTQQVLDEWLHGLQPSGWAWSKRADSNNAGFMAPFAGTVADLETAIEAMVKEIGPGTSTLLLADYEAVLGPDPCGRDALAETVDQRQALAAQRWLGRGGQRIADYVQMAAQLGVTITIDEPQPAICGEAVCGAAVCSTLDDYFVWVVNIHTGSPSLVPDAAICAEAVCGASVCGDVTPPVDTDAAAMIMCPITRQHQADTDVVFNFVSA